MHQFKTSRSIHVVAILALLTSPCIIQAQESVKTLELARPDMEFKIFQFPHDAIPRMDGRTDDWDMVPGSFRYGTDQLNDTEDGHGTDIDPEDLDVSVTVGWVEGENRLYFLYEAYDDYWDFDRSRPAGYLNDIFEVSVDGDLSGGNFIFSPAIDGNFRNINRGSPTYIENFLDFAGVHAQNYHIYTPPVNNNWGYVWGAQPWADEFPFANFAYAYDFNPGESGHLILEFWITPFDHAPSEGPENAVESELEEGKLIGLSWSILDFDGGPRDGHYNLSHDAAMVRDASRLCAFRLMPMESSLQPEIRAEWSFEILDMELGKVAFRDESIGDINSWMWDFGDSTYSTEQHPVHTFRYSGVLKKITLDVKGPAGSSRKTRFREVNIR